MKKFSIIVLFLAMLKPGKAQPLFAGTWEGKLNVGITLRVVFHFAQKADGTFAGTLDSPDQNAMGLPCSSVSFKNDSINVTMDLLHASFDAVMTNDTTLAGVFKQGGGSFPLVVYRTEKASSLNRPQTPVPPFSYASEDVEYNNAAGSIHYSATFTHPKGSGPFVTALLITGSGRQNRDEEIFEHKPFAVIADFLSKNGIAVLRVDDRGIGASTGDVKNATSADFANDVEASLAYLQTRKEVDKKRMGLIGHSEGGLIAAIVASRNPNISFVISLAGPGIRGDELLIEQNRAVLVAGGVTQESTNAYITLFTNLMHTVSNSADTNGISRKIFDDFSTWRSQQKSTVLAELHMDREEDNIKTLEALRQQFSYQWMKYFLNADPAVYLEKVTCKWLALNGSKDTQVLPASNLEGIRSALAKSKSGGYSIKEFEGLNHLFQHCTACTVAEYGTIEETFSTEVLTAMKNWLQEVMVK